MQKWIIFPVCGALLVGCASAPQPNVSYVDSGAQGQVAGTGIESQDIISAAKQAAASILALDVIAKAPTPPTIMIAPVVNKSSMPIDSTIYNTKLRGTLLQFAPGKIRFLARDVAQGLNEDEQKKKDAQGAQKPRRIAGTYDYLLATDISGLAVSSSQGQSDYFLVSFKLVDINDVIVWENQYEVKKEGRESAVYR